MEKYEKIISKKIKSHFSLIRSIVILCLTLTANIYGRKCKFILGIFRIKNEIDLNFIGSYKCVKKEIS